MITATRSDNRAAIHREAVRSASSASNNTVRHFDHRHVLVQDHVLYGFVAHA